MAMLESNGCPVEQLQTLKNTVTNQDVRNMTETEHEVESKKRDERRTQIKRPKKKIQFNLQNNITREFRTEDIVLHDEDAPDIKSA